MERVRKSLEGKINLEIDVKPYVLYPQIPSGGLPKEVFAQKVKPGMGRSLRTESEKEGIVVRYKNIERIPYSLEAHRLTWLVESSLKYELAKRIFHGYFEEGQDIEDHDFLIEQAKAVGVSKKTIGIFFSTDAGEKAVNDFIQNAKEDFVTVVPSLRLNGKILIPGLQTAELWENYIARAARIQKK